MGRIAALYMVPALGWCAAAAAATAPGAGAGAAQSTPLIHPFSAEDCETLACRPAGRSYTVKTGDGKDQAVDVPRSPYVTKDGTIVIFPGERLIIDFPVAGALAGVPRFRSA